MKCSHGTRVVALLALSVVACKPFSCDSGKQLVETADPSAQPATVLPLESGRMDARDGGASQPPVAAPSGRAPPSFEPYEQPPPDQLEDPEDLAGAVLHGAWRYRTPPPTLSVPQAATDIIQQAREAAEPRWRIELATAGRMRVDIDSLAQPLPKGTVLLARSDHLGTALVWPDVSRYRVIVPGALRSVLGDRRADVSPLSYPSIEIHAEPPSERLGLATRRVTVRTALGEAHLELAAIPEAGEGAPLFCRLILEIAGADPASELCLAPETVVFADIRWLDAGGIRFELSAVERHKDLSAQRVALPPRRARFVTSGLPAFTPVFQASEELSAFRREAVTRPGPQDPSAPTQGLVAENDGHELLYMVVDGVPVAAVGPLETVSVDGFKPGRYALQWRTFLGEIETPVSDVDLPARIVRTFEPPPEAEKPDAG